MFCFFVLFCLGFLSVSLDSEKAGLIALGGIKGADSYGVGSTELGIYKNVPWLFPPIRFTKLLQYVCMPCAEQGGNHTQLFKNS